MSTASGAGGMTGSETTALIDAAMLEQMYHYQPIVWTAAMFAGLFGVVTLAMVLLNVRWPGRSVMYVIVATGAMEVLGYGLRVLCIYQPSKGVYIGTTCLLLISPVVLAFVNYVIVGDLLRASGVRLWIINPDYLAKMFLASDIVCLIVQGGGGGLMASNSTQMFNIGRALVLFGLALQMCFFTCFTVITTVIALKEKYMLKYAPQLRAVFAGLLSTIILMYIRNIYRIIEFGSGSDSYLVQNEWVFYVFESAPIFLAFNCYGIFHFGRTLEFTEPGHKTPLWLEQVQAAKDTHGNGNDGSDAAAASQGFDVELSAMAS